MNPNGYYSNLDKFSIKLSEGENVKVQSLKRVRMSSLRQIFAHSNKEFSSIYSIEVTEMLNFRIF